MSIFDKLRSSEPKDPRPQQAAVVALEAFRREKNPGQTPEAYAAEVAATYREMRREQSDFIMQQALLGASGWQIQRALAKAMNADELPTVVPINRNPRDKTQLQLLSGIVPDQALMVDLPQYWNFETPNDVAVRLDPSYRPTGNDFRTQRTPTIPISPSYTDIPYNAAVIDAINRHMAGRVPVGEDPVF